MKRFAALALATGLLAACGSDNGTADADGDGVISADEMRDEMADGSNGKMRPGQWEQTMTITEFDVPGMPEEMKGMMSGQLGQTITMSHCLTEDEAAKTDADFFAGEGQENCEFQEFDRSGNRMTLRMTCSTPEGGTAKIAMDGEFSEDSYSLTMDNQVTGISGMPGGEMKMKGQMSAKRIGDCAG
ncbi:DUF3617 domain-containing protein [Altererythrobacter sp. GH1-8]|uniref:DUF3617 domain-containing protein n=1 Tax=Altererythrobacter sp. GH1-8 TaxID=3349333 RepID=UPI00374D2C67